MTAPKKSSDEVLAFKTSVALNGWEDDQLIKISKDQERSKSYILRAALNFYLAAH